MYRLFSVDDVKNGADADVEVTFPGTFNKPKDTFVSFYRGSRLRKERTIVYPCVRYTY